MRGGRFLPRSGGEAEVGRREKRNWNLGWMGSSGKGGPVLASRESKRVEVYGVSED